MPWFIVAVGVLLFAIPRALGGDAAKRDKTDMAISFAVREAIRKAPGNRWILIRLGPLLRFGAMQDVNVYGAYASQAAASAAADSVPSPPPGQWLIETIDKDNDDVVVETK